MLTVDKKLAGKIRQITLFIYVTMEHKNVTSLLFFLILYMTCLLDHHRAKNTHYDFV